MTISVVQSLPTWLPLTSPWLYNQVVEMRERVDSHVACIRTDNLDQFPFDNLHCLSDQPWRMRWEFGARRLRIRKHLPFLVDIVRKTKSDIVHSHWGDAAWLDMPSVRAAKARHVVTFYGKDVNFLPVQDPRWLARYRALFESADLVLCEGPHMAKCIVELGCAVQKVRVHHLGVDVGAIEFRPRRWAAGDPLRVLIAASFREKKGIPLALLALGRIRHKVGSLTVTIIGDASSDPRSVPEKERILGAIRDSGLGSSVRMLGYQPHDVLLREAYEHHIFLSPSLTAPDGDTEGGAPIALLDMAASGMPIVSSTHCDIPNVVIDEVTGLLAKEGDLESLVGNLEAMVGQPQRWTELCEAGRARTEQEFDVRIQAARLADLYGHLSTSGARA